MCSFLFVWVPRGTYYLLLFPATSVFLSAYLYIIWTLLWVHKILNIIATTKKRMKIWSSTSNFNRKSEVALQIITRFYYIIESWLPYLLPEIIWHFRWKRTLWSSIDILPLDALLRCHQQIAVTGTSGLSYQILYP